MRRGMKFLIASDIHGSAYYCEQLLQAFEREQAARLLLLGDILYHGPRNDLPRDYAPKKVIAMLNGMADIILCVRGNCDTEVDQMVLEFPILADYAVLPTGERLVYVTHGHQFNTKTPPPLCQGDVLLHGHTHIPAWAIGIARLAKKYGKPVLAFSGSVTEDAASCNEAGIDAFFPILRQVTTLEEAMDPQTAQKNMESAVEQVFRVIRLKERNW